MKIKLWARNTSDKSWRLGCEMNWVCTNVEIGPKISLIKAREIKKIAIEEYKTKGFRVAWLRIYFSGVLNHWRMIILQEKRVP